MPTETTPKLTDAHVRQYREQGYCLLERAVPAEHLGLLREACAANIAHLDAEMDRRGVDTLGINHRGKRYFVADPSTRTPELRRFVFSELMAHACERLVGPDAYLFWEQYVVKGAEVGMTFSWHQDSAYVGFPHQPYLTCWIPLDDVDEANGTAYVLPYDRAGTREMVEHKQDPETNDLVGYFGDDPGIPLICPAGSVAFFSSVTFHRSGANTTRNMRRVFLAQYAAEQMVDPATGQVKGNFEAVVKGGERVAE
jgi:ectoine hydroxylase-related dioxygenase (phytanoyl-CoA dioxygenase family)